MKNKRWGGYFSNLSQFYNLGLAICCIFMVPLLLSGCEHKSKLLFDKIEEGPRELYADAQKAEDNNYKLAIQKIEQIEKYYPHDAILADAEVLKAELYYKNDQFKDVIFVADYFIDNFPSHRQIEYIYYLRAMAFFNQIFVASRDQNITEETIVAINDLKYKFPNSQYARDLNQKLHYAYTVAADKEMQIGRYYAQQMDIVGAIQRFHNVLHLYSFTMLIEEALYRLTWCYMQLGLREQAEQYVALLNYNYKESKWTKLAEQLVHLSVRKGREESIVVDNVGQLKNGKMSRLLQGQTK